MRGGRRGEGGLLGARYAVVYADEGLRPVGGERPLCVGAAGVLPVVERAARVTVELDDVRGARGHRSEGLRREPGRDRAPRAAIEDGEVARDRQAVLVDRPYGYRRRPSRRSGCRCCRGRRGRCRRLRPGHRDRLGHGRGRPGARDGGRRRRRLGRGGRRTWRGHCGGQRC